MDLVTLALAKNFTNEKVSEVDERVTKIEDLSPFTYKGSVPSYADLPANAKKGETYTIEDTGDEYVYGGNSWIKLGNNITTEDLDTKQDKLTENNAGNQITITTENGIVKINATPIPGINGVSSSIIDFVNIDGTQNNLSSVLSKFTNNTEWLETSNNKKILLITKQDGQYSFNDITLNLSKNSFLSFYINAVKTKETWEILDIVLEDTFECVDKTQVEELINNTLGTIEQQLGGI